MLMQLVFWLRVIFLCSIACLYPLKQHFGHRPVIPRQTLVPGKPSKMPSTVRSFHFYVPKGFCVECEKRNSVFTRFHPVFSRRAVLGSYHLCGDNHGIRPPNPEQYLTPLQQKEVAIRHLRTKLLESENRVHDR